MRTLEGKSIVVAGGTGNVGSFVVRALLEQGATVAVPSRAEENLDALRAYLSNHVDKTDLDQLHPFVGDLGDEAGAEALRKEIDDQLTAPQAVLASLGRWHAVPSLLSARSADLERVLQDYLVAHHTVARTFLPGLKASGGVYVFVNGPLAFDVWRPDAALVSIATAAQHMLFRALAAELEGSPVQVAELVTHAFIRNRETQPGSPLPGEAVGAYAAHLLSGAAGAIHGQSIQLRSTELLEAAGLESPLT